jgi:hypothetical protein
MIEKQIKGEKQKANRIIGTDEIGLFAFSHLAFKTLY